MPAESIPNERKLEEGLVECKITDEFFVGLKDATLKRTIVYKNPSKFSSVQVVLSKANYFPYQCEDFVAMVDESPCQINEDKRQYRREIVIDFPDKELKPNEELKLQIECRWRDFYTYLPYFYFSFQFGHETNYTLILRNSGLMRTLHVIQVNDKLAKKDVDYHISDDFVLFNPIKVSYNNEVSYRISSIFTPLQLPVLESIRENNATLFSNFSIIVIQHLLSDAVHLVEAFARNGADKNGMFIIGIPYSTKYHTVNYLRCKGYPNIYSPIEYLGFDEVVKEAMNSAIEYAEKYNKKILIVEDGGYAVPLLHYEFSTKNELFVGAVEQTANGIWRDEDIKDKRGMEYLIPIIDIARSDIKKKLESPLIGESVSKNIELVYNKSYRGIRGKKVALIGYGSTGKEVARCLKNIGVIVKVFDTKEENRAMAVKDGFETKESIKELLKGVEIIVEATGRTWATDPKEMAEIILEFPNGSYFASASSKRLGIAYDIFDKLIQPNSIVNFPGIGVMVKLLSGSDVILIANGYPINFFLGESVPDIEIGFIISWLYKAAEILTVKYNELPLGIVDTNNKDKWGYYDAQNTISEFHKKFK